MKNRFYVIVKNRIASLPISLVTYGRNYDQNKCSYPRGARESHLFYVLSGSGIFEIDGEKINVKSGDFLFYKQNVPVKYYPENDEFKVDFLTFMGFAGISILEHYKVPNGLKFQNDTVHKDFYKVLEAADKNIGQEDISALLYTLVVNFGKMYGKICRSNFEKAVDFIESYYFKDISVSDVAKAADVSESYVFKCFKKELGTTPVAYINKVRINMAKYLLKKEEEMSVENVAKTVGYNSRTYFIECFKRETGLTPMQYKKERP